MPASDPEKRREYNRQYRARNGEALKAKSRAWYAANKTTKVKEYAEAHRSERLAKKRTDRLKRYGLTPEQFDHMLSSQGGRCAICKRKQEHAPKGRLHVDHDHRTGKVRGLLCSQCNTALGKFGEREENLRNAIDYLLRYRNEATIR